MVDIFQKLKSEFVDSKKYKSVAHLFTDRAVKDIGFLEADGSWNKAASGGFSSKQDRLKNATEEQVKKAVEEYIEKAKTHLVYWKNKKFGSKEDNYQFPNNEDADYYVFVYGGKGAVEHLVKKEHHLGNKDLKNKEDKTHGNKNQVSRSIGDNGLEQNENTNIIAKQNSNKNTVSKNEGENYIELSELQHKDINLGSAKFNQRKIENSKTKPEVKNVPKADNKTDFSFTLATGKLPDEIETFDSRRLFLTTKFLTSGSYGHSTNYNIGATLNASLFDRESRIPKFDTTHPFITPQRFSGETQNLFVSTKFNIGRYDVVAEAHHKLEKTLEDYASVEFKKHASSKNSLSLNLFSGTFISALAPRVDIFSADGDKTKTPFAAKLSAETNTKVLNNKLQLTAGIAYSPIAQYSPFSKTEPKEPISANFFSGAGSINFSSNKFNANIYGSYQNTDPKQDNISSAELKNWGAKFTLTPNKKLSLSIKANEFETNSGGENFLQQNIEQSTRVNLSKNSNLEIFESLGKQELFNNKSQKLTFQNLFNAGVRYSPERHNEFGVNTSFLLGQGNSKESLTEARLFWTHKF